MFHDVPDIPLPSGMFLSWKGAAGGWAWRDSGGDRSCPGQGDSGTEEAGRKGTVV